MSTELERNARLDAIGTVRALLANDRAGAQVLLQETEDATEMAHAACGFVVGLLGLMPAEQRTHVLDELVRAAVNE